MVDIEKVLEAHKKKTGKIEIVGRVAINTPQDLAIYYTPGVAEVSLVIKKDKSKAYDYTSKANTIAIISDGTRILGLGDVGPEAGLPVLEGKALLFKKFGGVDAVPICIGTNDEDEIVDFVKKIAPTFGAVVIEDIESPKSFSIVDRLSSDLDIPVFHDDQQGVGAVVVGALINALKLAGKKMKDVKIVINGSGSAGIGVVRLLNHIGVKKVYVVDTKGVIYNGREDGMNDVKRSIAKITNGEAMTGSLHDVVKGADVLIGISNKGAFSESMISSMAEKPIVFALANPDPEIGYANAKRAGAFIVATGASNVPNQVNNLLVFPGLMRGVLDTRAKVNYHILYSAAKAIANSVGAKLDTEMIVPDINDAKSASLLMGNVAKAVAKAAIDSGAARNRVDPAEVKKRARFLISRYSKIEKRISRL